MSYLHFGNTTVYLRERIHQNHYWRGVSLFGFCCCDETLTKATWRRKESICLSRLHFNIKGNQGRNSKQEQKMTMVGHCLLTFKWLTHLPSTFSSGQRALR